MEELNKRLPQLPWIVTAVGVVIAGWFFFSAIKIGADIVDRQSEITACNMTIEQCKRLERVYGRGSARYYADRPMLILKAGGLEGKVTIFWDDSVIAVPKGKSARANMSRDSTVESRWADKFNAEHLADVIVKPGNSAGCYPLTFTDNISDDKFQVLVVIK